jgi:hypothetical protein
MEETPVVIGVYENGDKIWSDKHPGALAGIDEIIEKLLQKYLSKKYPETKPWLTTYEYDSDLKNIKTLPCGGEKIRPVPLEFVYTPEGNIHPTVVSLCYKLSHTTVGDLLNSLLLKDKEIISNLSHTLFELAEIAYVAERQLDQDRWKLDSIRLKKLYTSMPYADWKDYEPELCHICLENKNNDCKYLEDTRNERHEKWKDLERHGIKRK